MTPRNEAPVITAADLKDWQLDLRLAGKSPNTITSYAQGAAAYLATSGGAVTRAAVREHLAGLAGLAPSTQALRLVHLKIFFKWLKAEHLIDHDPTRGMTQPRPRPKVIEPLTDAEIRSIIGACASARDRAIVMLLADTGLRVGELAGIQLKNLDLDRQQILVYGKGGRWRTVPVSNRAARELSRYLRQRNRSAYADDPALWTGERGAMAAKGVTAVIRRAAARAGVEHANPHRYRHTFADHWLADDGSEQALMTIAGWSSRSMLDRYSAARATDRAMAEFHRLRH